MGTPVEMIADFAQPLQKIVVVRFFEINVGAGVAAGGEMIERAGEFEAQGAGHGCRSLCYRDERNAPSCVCFIARPDPIFCDPIFLARELMAPPEPPKKRRIGFVQTDD